MRSTWIRSASLALLLSFAPQVAITQPAQAAEVRATGKAAAQASILIKAPPRIVWRAIHAERTQNPELEYSKIVGEQGNIKTIEQKFLNIPMLGSVTAVTRQVEDPEKHIDYSLVHSDKFKALEGSWDLTPVNGGKETMLQLQSHLDIGIPFSNIFIKGATQKKLEKRVANIKTIAEHEQARIAAKGGE